MSLQERVKRKAISTSVVSALLCGSLLWSPGCSTPALTEIVVNVDSAFPAGELDLVRLLIVRDGESRVVTANLSEVSLPFTQGVVHRGGPLGVSISAQGIFEERVIVEQVVPVQYFVEGETLQVHLELSPSCIGITCDAGSACVAGACMTPTDAGVADAGVDGSYGRGECPADRTDIVGDYVCAAGCENCNVRCRRGDCRVTCLAGATCNIESDDHEIVAECEEGSTCSIRTREEGGVSVRCFRSTCDVNCEGDSRCEVLCDQSSCGVDCQDNEMCSLRGCDPDNCGRDQLACGRECR